MEIEQIKKLYEEYNELMDATEMEYDELSFIDFIELRREEE